MASTSNHRLNIDTLNRMIETGQALLANQKEHTGGWGGAHYFTVDNAGYRAWRSQILDYVRTRLTQDSLYYKGLYGALDSGGYSSYVETGIQFLNSIIEDINAGVFVATTQVVEAGVILMQIADRFHRVAIKLRSRYDGRETLHITDEYDVQDLLHSILYLFFDDIRPEEYTPSYAGSSSRIDFILPEHDFVVEVKKTRANLRDRQLADELINDTARYQTHPNCKHLFCLVYDPDGFLRTPRAIERDLSGQKDKTHVTVVIRPIH